MNTAYISPDSFDVGLSLALVVGAVIGGLGTGIGPILGAVFTVWSPRYTQILFNAKPDIAFGGLLIVVMYTMPSVIAGGVYRLWAWNQRSRRARRTKSGA